MATLDYPTQEELKVELESLPVHANGGPEESSGSHASLVADITAAVLAALDAKAKDAAGNAAQTWKGEWNGKNGTWKRSPSGEWKLEDSAANESGASTSTPIANAAATAKADPFEEDDPWQSALNQRSQEAYSGEYGDARYQGSVSYTHLTLPTKA